MVDARVQDGVRPGLVVFAALAVLLGGTGLVIGRYADHDRAGLTAYPSGVTAASVARAASLAENSNVPAAIMAAIPVSYGTDPMQPARAYTTAEQDAAIRNNTPVGPYKLTYQGVHAFAKAYKVLPLSFKEMADPQRSGNWLVGAASAVIHAKRYPAVSVDLTAGTTAQPYFNAATNHVDQRTPIQTTAGKTARTTARTSWVAVLSALPMAGIASRAPGVYDSAFHWTMVGSLAQNCGGIPQTTANTGVLPPAGRWLSPVPSSGVLAGFGGGHNGVDLAAAAGAPVFAATSGVVKRVSGGLVLFAGNALALTYGGVTVGVGDGQQIKVGQRLGTVSATPSDQTGAGPHLHFGVNTVHANVATTPTWVDPVAFMKARGVALGSATVGAPNLISRTAATSIRTTEGASATQGLMDVWQGSQLSTASTLIATGQRLRVPAWGIQIALMTAMQGSRLGTELPTAGSPRGVLALPASWGSEADRRDVVRAATMFYGRLVKVPDWSTIKPWDAAARTGAYAGTAVESHRAKWSGAGIIMNALGTPATTSTYGTEGTVGGGCTGATTSGPTVNLSGGFRVASLNVLGCTWIYSPYGSCQSRFPAQWKYINDHGFSIVGTQEVQRDQFAMLLAKVNATGSTWSMYPTTSTFPGLEATPILWRSDQWKLVTGYMFKTARWTQGNADASCTNYFTIDEPMVLLENAAGKRVWVMNAHNIHPGDKGFAKCQVRDIAVEAQEFAGRYAMGIPVIFVADTNETHANTICGLQARTPSAHSIWPPAAGVCASPNTSKAEPMDKIFGSGGTVFSDIQIDYSPYDTRMTDHPIPSTLVQLR